MTYVVILIDIELLCHLDQFKPSLLEQSVQFKLLNNFLLRTVLYLGFPVYAFYKYLLCALCLMQDLVYSKLHLRMWLFTFLCCYIFMHNAPTMKDVCLCMTDSTIWEHVHKMEQGIKANRYLKPSHSSRKIVYSLLFFKEVLQYATVL